MGKYGRIAGGIVLTAFFLWLALRNVDLQAVRVALAQANYRYLFPAALCGIVGYLFRTWRWQRILVKTQAIAFWRLFPVLMVGFATNNLLPARVGEFVRAYLLSREEEVSPSLALATLVVERVCDGLTLIALMAMTLLTFPLPITDSRLQTVETVAALIFGLATLVLVALLCLPRPILALVQWCLRIVPTAIASRITALLEQFIAGLAALRSPVILAQIALLSLVIWFCEGGTFAFVLLAFPLGLSGSAWLAAAVFLLVFVNLGIMIPSAPGYVGTYQLFAKLALGAFGIAASSAVALSFVAHALQYTLITAVGLFSLWRLGLSPRNLGAMARAEQAVIAQHGDSAIVVAD